MFDTVIVSNTRLYVCIYVIYIPLFNQKSFQSSYHRQLWYYVSIQCTYPAGSCLCVSYIPITFHVYTEICIYEYRYISMYIKSPEKTHNIYTSHIGRRENVLIGETLVVSQSFHSNWWGLLGSKKGDSFWEELVTPKGRGC